ncbi:MAG: hypothetical protein QM811_00535 [Pirellulales bacterium]
MIAGLLVILSGLALLWGTPKYFDQLPIWVERTRTEHWHLLWIALGGLIGLRCVWAILDPKPELVQAGVMQCLRSLIILDAVACFSVCDMYGALCVLPLLIPQMLLARAIYTT